MAEPAVTVTSLLDRARAGDTPAMGQLFELVYDQLRRLAQSQRRRQDERTLNTTALVHEAFIKLADRESLDVRDRAHFLAVAATAMRQILIDHARQRLAGKRGGGMRPIPLDAIESVLDAGGEFSDDEAHVLVALGESVEQLALRSQRQGRVVECRFFAGMSIEDTALALGTSPATVKRDWSIAQAWLHRDLSERLR